MNEELFVRWLCRSRLSPGKSVRLGIGDDAALVRVRPGYELILTSDLTIEGIHFTRWLYPSRAVGYRAMARAVSDIAAMGGEPRFALVSLGLARGTPGAWIKQLFAGLRSSARRFGVEIVGGDTAVGVGRTVVDITVAGEIPPGKALRRSGAAPGDQIFVSGTLGASAQGLKLLQAGDKQTRGAGAALVRSHLFPEPRLALGRFLREKGLASAALDLSDGLSTDLNRLCRASGVGARVWAELLPLSEGAGVGSRAEPREVLSLALHGGEDYELLFTVPVRLASQVPPHHCGLPLRRIGEILPTPRVEVALPDGKVTPLRAGGYDHFRKRNR